MDWTESIARREMARDRLRTMDRVGESFAIVAIFLVTLFFVANQTDQTGFFTSGFGTAEMVAFYGSSLYGILPPVLRLILGRRNSVRPFEVVGNGIFLVTASYLLSVFPFDFSHLSALLPQGTRFAVDWITDDVARGIIILSIVVLVFALLWTCFIYFLVRERLRGGASNPAAP